MFVDPCITDFGRGFAIANASVFGFFVCRAVGYENVVVTGRGGSAVGCFHCCSGGGSGVAAAIAIVSGAVVVGCCCGWRARAVIAVVVIVEGRRARSERRRRHGHSTGRVVGHCRLWLRLHIVLLLLLLLVLWRLLSGHGRHLSLIYGGRHRPALLLSSIAVLRTGC